MKWIGIGGLSLLALILIVGGLGAILADDQPKDSAAPITQLGPPPGPPTTRAATSTAPPPAAPAKMELPCKPAPQTIVAIIDAAFIDGQHLKHAQSVEGPQAMTIVGGNIFDAAGIKESSQDSWVLFNGGVFALSGDARRQTLLPDGRDLDPIFWDWPQYNDAVGKCVGAVERTENAGG